MDPKLETRLNQQLDKVKTRGGKKAPPPHTQELDLRLNKASQAAKDAIKAAADERSIKCYV